MKLILLLIVVLDTTSIATAAYTKTRDGWLVGYYKQGLAGGIDILTLHINEDQQVFLQPLRWLEKKNELKEIAPDALKPQTEEGAALNPVPSHESLADQ